jgi:hypothetical protein
VDADVDKCTVTDVDVDESTTDAKFVTVAKLATVAKFATVANFRQRTHVESQILDSALT